MTYIYLQVSNTKKITKYVIYFFFIRWWIISRLRCHLNWEIPPYRTYWKRR